MHLIRGIAFFALAAAAAPTTSPDPAQGPSHVALRAANRKRHEPDYPMVCLPSEVWPGADDTRPGDGVIIPEAISEICKSLSGGMYELGESRQLSYLREGAWKIDFKVSNARARRPGLRQDTCERRMHEIVRKCAPAHGGEFQRDGWSL
jgi:hypothetical protein